MYRVGFDEKVRNADRLLVKEYFSSIGCESVKTLYEKRLGTTHKIMIIIDNSTEEEIHIQLAEISYALYTRRENKILKIKRIEYL